MKKGYIECKIIGHTQLTFGNTQEDLWYKDMIGQTVCVKIPAHVSAFVEHEDGASMLKKDLEPVKNLGDAQLWMMLSDLPMAGKGHVMTKKDWKGIYGYELGLTPGAKWRKVIGGEA